MATSSSTDFTVTRDDIIRDALLELKVIDSTVAVADAIESTELDDAARKLNMMVKSWATFTNLWTTKDVTVTLTPGTESYTVGTGLDIDTDRPLGVVAARRQDSSGNEIPIWVYSRNEYMDLPTKSTQSPANGVYYDPQLTGTLYVWPTGSTGNVTVIVTFKRPIEDFDAAADNPDFPQEWYLAIVLNLAVLLARQFGAAVSQDLRQDAMSYLAMITDHDAESVPIRIEVA